MFALFTSRTGSLNGLPASTTSYLHKDHLGSVAAITTADGALAERLAYDPWGKRRHIHATPGRPDTRDAIVGVSTDRGYTEHEHLDEIGIIHMNGACGRCVLNPTQPGPTNAPEQPVGGINTPPPGTTPPGQTPVSTNAPEVPVAECSMCTARPTTPPGTPGLTPKAPVGAGVSPDSTIVNANTGSSSLVTDSSKALNVSQNAMTDLGVNRADTTVPTGNDSIQVAGSTGTPGNNQAQNAQVKAVVRILALTPDQRQQLHREISGQNYSFHEILETGKYIKNGQ